MNETSSSTSSRHGRHGPMPCGSASPSGFSSTPRRRWRAIDVRGVTKSFEGREVVHDLSMQVKRGTIYGFLGPNGSGKTTTIRMLCGLLTPDSGEGRCLGYDIRGDADKNKRTAG